MVVFLAVNLVRILLSGIWICSFIPARRRANYAFIIDKMERFTSRTVARSFARTFTNWITTHAGLNCGAIGLFMYMAAMESIYIYVMIGATQKFYSTVRGSCTACANRVRSRSMMVRRYCELTMYWTTSVCISICTSSWTVKNCKRIRRRLTYVLKQQISYTTLSFREWI